MKKIYLLLLIFSISYSMKAQWTQMNGPCGGDISCVTVNGTVIYAGILTGGAWISANNGSTWTDVSYGLPYYEVTEIAVTGSYIFASTYGGGVYLSTNNGGSWNSVNSGLSWSDITCMTLKGTTLFAGTRHN